MAISSRCLRTILDALTRWVSTYRLAIMAKARRRRFAFALVLVASLVVAPQAGAASPGSFFDIGEMDRLILEQEGLLHVYRCRFDVDIELVPGGCRNGMPVRLVESPPPFNGTPTM